MTPLILMIPEVMTGAEHSTATGRAEEERILQQLERKIQGMNRPRLVLDCSRLSRVGIAEIRVLLACLEKVMKHNGDARLAEVPPEAMDLLSHARVDRLFRIYASREDAVKSFASQPDTTLSGDGHSSGLRRTYPDVEGVIPARPLQWMAPRKRGEANEPSKESRESRG